MHAALQIAQCHLAGPPHHCPSTNGRKGLLSAERLPLASPATWGAVPRHPESGTFKVPSFLLWKHLPPLHICVCGSATRPHQAAFSSRHVEVSDVFMERGMNG